MMSTNFVFDTDKWAQTSVSEHKGKLGATGTSTNNNTTVMDPVNYCKYS